MESAWETAGNQLLAEHGLTIGKARKSMTGWAPWVGDYIMCPLPRSAKSFAILAHEVGHKALKHGRKGLSCSHEWEAEQFAIQQFRRFGLKLPRVVSARMNYHIAYSLAQALNRGMKAVPADLLPYKKLLVCRDMSIVYGDGRHKVVKRYYVRRIPS